MICLRAATAALTIALITTLPAWPSAQSRVFDQTVPLASGGRLAVESNKGSL